ncbi:MAG: hypothetical protein RBR08_02815 [Desulforegulaceae bacterium]|nr:hypothetical protein [Desulforegulaceae bacterium]
MKKKIFALSIVFALIFFVSPLFAGFNCITHERGVKIVWFGEKGYVEFTKIRNLTSDFNVLVYAENESRVLFSGLPVANQKIQIPKGIKEVGLKISSGQGEVCYSRGN